MLIEGSAFAVSNGKTKVEEVKEPSRNQQPQRVAEPTALPLPDLSKGLKPKVSPYIFAGLENVIQAHIGAGSQSVFSILKAVSLVTGLEIKVITGKRRQMHICDARGIAISFVHQYHPELTLRQIGAYFSDMDHSSIIHNLRKAEQLLETNPNFTALYKSCLEKLKNPNPLTGTAYQTT